MLHGINDGYARNDRCVWEGVLPLLSLIDGKDYGFESDLTRIQRSKKNTSHHKSSMKVFSMESFGICNELIDLNHAQRQVNVNGVETNVEPWELNNHIDYVHEEENKLMNEKFPLI